MRDLQQQVIKAHGGLERFRQFSFLTARLRQFGVLWDLKGKPDVLAHANVRVNLRKEEVSHWPFQPTQYRSRFTPDEVRIEAPDGGVVGRLPQPRASFAGFAMETHWSNPQLAYFAGYTMWTYLTSPFILAQPGVRAEEITPWSEAGQTWRRLRATHRPPSRSSLASIFRTTGLSEVSRAPGVGGETNTSAANIDGSSRSTLSVADRLHQMLFCLDRP
jgi:hypothetical protein